jgi:PAS domain S-box-containing protein
MMMLASGAGEPRVERLRLLLLENRDQDVELVTSLLAGEGFELEAQVAPSLAALSPFSPGRFDVVLSDYSLPDGNALDALARVRACDDDVPFLVVSNSVGVEHAVEVMHAGVSDVLLKDNLARLGGSVRRFLEAALERRRRVEAEAALAHAEQELRLIVEQAPIGIMIRDGVTICYANQALAGYLGFSDAASIVGRSVFDLVNEHDREPMIERAREVADGGPGKPIDLHCERVDGQSVVLEVGAARRVRFRHRDCMMILLRDVTHERQLRERLLMADRLAAVGTLAAGVAHEINNPLACVTANLEVLDEELGAAGDGGADLARMPLSELRAALADAREGAERVRLIVRDLRVFARGDDQERGPVDVRGAIEVAERMTANLMRGRARVVKELGDVPPVHANGPRLAQVFVQLLVNAAQAMETGRPEVNQVRITAHVDGARVAIDVADTGHGIPEELRGRVFDPFFTTRAVGSGPGLGLAVCHGIVRSLGGEISVESAPGGGTLFRISLPIAKSVQLAP